MDSLAEWLAPREKNITQNTSEARASFFEIFIRNVSGQTTDVNKSNAMQELSGRRRGLPRNVGRCTRISQSRFIIGHRDGDDGDEDVS